MDLLRHAACPCPPPNYKVTAAVARQESHLSRTYNKSASFFTGKHHWINPLQRACGSRVNVLAATQCCFYFLSHQSSCAGPSQGKATLPSPFWMEEFPPRVAEGCCKPARFSTFHTHYSPNSWSNHWDWRILWRIQTPAQWGWGSQCWEDE